MAILVTGAAGFIGFHVSKLLLSEGHKVIGVDNLNDYYDVSLKQARLSQLIDNADFDFHKVDLSDKEQSEILFNGAAKDVTQIIHLAAQAGVRYSLENPHAYISSNINGHLNVIEGGRQLGNLKSIIYASSSSVYGGNKKIPFSTGDEVNQPCSLYAATKRADELMSYAYAHLYKVPMVGLRFFTVYGPWGRPDMTPYVFCDAMREERSIKVFNKGIMKRDFTYVDDIVDGISKAMNFIPDEDNNGARHKVFNLGNNKPEKLMDFIATIEKEMGFEAEKDFLDMQKGDVPETYADIDEAKNLLEYQPKTSIEFGVASFVTWYKDYYKM